MEQSPKPATQPQTTSFTRLFRKPLVAGGIGLLLGALVVLGIRFATYHPQGTHYHANFAVYINGQRQEFKSPFYYEEVAACDAQGEITPKQRAHLHDFKNDVVHVHDHGVTWGAFLQNIGWAAGKDFLKTSDALLRPDDTHHLTFMVNGQPQRDIANLRIGDRDRLLISYGSDDSATLQKQADSVANSAARYDTTKDPASCSGSQDSGVKARFKHLF